MTKLTYNHDIGKCEACDKRISDQEPYQTTVDWVVLCVKDASTYQDILDQWQEFYADNQDFPEPYQSRAQFEGVWSDYKSRGSDFLLTKPLLGPMEATP